MDHGQIVLAPFPYSDLRGMKRRPACVVSGASCNEGPDVIVAMVTSSGTRRDDPGMGDVTINDWRTAGLRRPSVVRTLCRLLVLERRLLTALLGSLVPDDVEAVNRALLTVFGLK